MPIRTKGRLLNYTTQIEPVASVGVITQYLASHGASKIQLSYDDQSNINALAFAINLENQELGFKLPINIEIVYQILSIQAKMKKLPKRYVNHHQAERIAWRIMKDWIEAQIALIETGMVKIEEVFLPYLIVSPQRTLFQQMQNKWLLPAPKEYEDNN